MEYLTIALDAMGGDFGPTVTIPAALNALTLHPKLKMLIVGNPSIIKPILSKTNVLLLKRLKMIPTNSVISSEAKPSQAIRMSKGTSMRVALELIKSGNAQACVSAGNTGALMGVAKLVLKSLKGIERPALTVILPNKIKGKTVLLDLGANIECNKLMLAQFAIMGSVLAEQIVGIKNPRVALLNIGQEAIKGLENIKQASAILKNMPSMHYIGYLEANELLTGKTDVLVCDGFTGNITLKTMEGVMRVIISLLISESYNTKNNWLTKKIKHWIQQKFMHQFNKLNPDLYNGAYLIGLLGIVIKSHGAANQKALTTAIEKAIKATEKKLTERIANRLDANLTKNSILIK